MHHHRAP
jgi:hypothetical protein